MELSSTDRTAKRAPLRSAVKSTKRELLDIVKRIYPDIVLALEEGIRLNVEREF